MLGWEGREVRGRVHGIFQTVCLFCAPCPFLCQQVKNKDYIQTNKQTHKQSQLILEVKLVEAI